MIKPGLLTASTSKADHSGMSGLSVCVCVCVCFSIVFAPFRCCIFVFKRECFPIVVTLAATGAAKHTRRAATQSRSRRLVLCGGGGQCERRGGNNWKKSRLEWNEE